MLGGGGKRRYVAVTNDKSGRILRENVRFAMYGEGGCPVNQDEKDCAIFAAGLRALAPAEATRGSIAGKKKDFLRVKVPTKPLGFLASSVVERDPARPEAHRSTVGTTPLVPKDKAV